MRLLLLPLTFVVAGVLSQRAYDDDDDTLNRLDKLSPEQQLCFRKGVRELFRLNVDDCRDVVQCTSAGLQAIRCPPGLFFDIEEQTCTWDWAVSNCDQLTKERKVQPKLFTDEPLCDQGYLACGNGNCIKKEFFCNGFDDCEDGSDENVCDLESDPNRSASCDTDICLLPDCFCSEDGTEVPADLCPDKENCTKVPQMVTITFEDAIHHSNIGLYDKIFNKKRKNPNGCDIKGTFFVSHKYTNYTAVQNLHQQGHEIGVHSLSNANEDYWTELSVDEWARQVSGQRLIIEKFANITENSVIGMRAPFLRPGGNNQFTMLEEQAFLYDSTLVAPVQNPPVWPYTVYHRMPHKCHNNPKNCPSRSIAAWEMVMNELDMGDTPNVNGKIPGCVVLGSCAINSGPDFHDFLNHNFYRHFNQNRAPFGLYFHSAWLKNAEYLNTFLEWLDEILEKHPEEVYFTTQTQVIQWMNEPVPLSKVPDFSPWKEKCSPEPRTSCDQPNDCQLTTDELPGEELQMTTCMKCPEEYPWLGNPAGIHTYIHKR